MERLRDWAFPQSETGERGLRGPLGLLLLAFLLLGVPLLLGVEPVL